MALFTTLKQTLLAVIVPTRLLFQPSHTRHQRLPSDTPLTADQSPPEAPFQQPDPTNSPATMPSFPSPEATALIVRLLQFICSFGWVFCAYIADANTGRWSFESVKATVVIGAIDTAITWLVTIGYGVFFREWLYDLPDYRQFKRVLMLMAAIIVDALIGSGWAITCVAALLPKRTDYGSLLVAPPKTVWYAGAVFAFIECCLFVWSIGMHLLIHHRNTTWDLNQAIQLATLTNVADTGNRGTDVPSTGLSRTG
ncbi:MAG: hypothetical protein LQ346_004224 [Caloplaca aetnensis]|nr:MAG: hypothetical protein LQ346_004224 [Caloplaca aetnensis]